MDLYMVFDIESIGLHGDAFSYGFVVVDASTGEEISCGECNCNPVDFKGTVANHEWVKANCRIELPICQSPLLLRRSFWSTWGYWKAQGAKLAADVPWPVEANFLSACVADDPVANEWQGPYPLIDVASVRLAAGFDPLAKEERYPDELPEHNPLADARQSARLLLEALPKNKGAK
jgi:hypothetical protein